MFKVSDFPPSIPIELGRVGENKYRMIQFDMSEWLEKYPSASILCVFKRPDGVVYPATVTHVDGIVTWTITSADVSVGGRGKVELRLVEGDVIGKSATAMTITAQAIGEADDTPESPKPSWLDLVAQEAKKSIDTANAVSNSIYITQIAPPISVINDAIILETPTLSMLGGTI